MSDLPGPEKPIVGTLPPSNGDDHRPLDPNALLEQFRAILAREGRPDGARGPYDGRSGQLLKGKVRERHRMAVALQVCGFRNNEIAKILGYTESRISIILNSKKPEIEQVRNETRDRVAESTVDLTMSFRMAAPDAFDTVKTLMDSKDEKIALASAKDILDRAGYTPVKKQANFNTDAPISELKEVLGKIDEANEVLERRREWEVHEPDQGAA